MLRRSTQTFMALFFSALLLAACQKPKPAQKEQSKAGSSTQAPGPITLVIHGGAGTILRENMTEEQEAAYRAKLTEALDTGYAVLERGGSAMDAVQHTINVMENSPLFNAGKGAVFTHEGKNAMDAAVMDGKTLNAGAVAGVGTIKNPINAARAVMEQSPHVMLSGHGAEEFAKEKGLTIVPPEYFFTQRRYDALQRVIKAEKMKEDSTKKTSYLTELPDHKFGTVGCVALDQDGNIAAGTSTGGMTNKRWGRIGDSPIIGAGTYADNNTCGISCTGHGEYFIRKQVAYDIAAKMKYAHMTLDSAAKKVVMDELVKFGGDGGIIGLDRQGNVAMEFNTPGMYRGYMKKPGEAHVFIYKDEK